MVFALKAFDFIWVLNRGGPGYASHILGVSMYKETFGFVIDRSILGHG
jgi:glucose/mannose transport system permease protein